MDINLQSPFKICVKRTLCTNDKYPTQGLQLDFTYILSFQNFLLVAAYINTKSMHSTLVIPAAFISCNV